MESVGTAGSDVESEPVPTQVPSVEEPVPTRVSPVEDLQTDEPIHTREPAMDHSPSGQDQLSRCEIRETLAQMTTMLQSLAAEVQRLKDGQDSVTSTKNTTAPSEPKTSFESGPSDQGEGTGSLAPLDAPHASSGKGDVRGEETKASSPIAGQKDSNPIHSPSQSPKEPEVWAARLCNTMALAKSSIPKFNGESVPAYWEFRRSLRRLFEETDLSQARQLEILVEAYSGPMKENLRSCLMMEDSKTGSERAWALLDKRHGNKHTYVRQLTERLLQGPPVSLQDSKGLLQLFDDLLICIDGLTAMGQLHQIDNLQTMFAVTRRFKGRLLDDYTDRRHAYRKKQGDVPGIRWLADFVKDMVDKMDDVVQELGQKASTSGEDNRMRHVPDRSSGTRKSTVLATVSSDTRAAGTCALCGCEHSLHHCATFLAMSLSDKEKVVRSQRRCFNCLERYHQASTCESKERCGIDGCPSFHSRLLHTPWRQKGGRRRGLSGNAGKGRSEAKRPREEDAHRTEDPKGDVKRFQPNPPKAATPRTDHTPDSNTGGPAASQSHVLMTADRDRYKWTRPQKGEDVNEHDA